MEKVIVTGGAGFIGSNLVDRLIELGYHVLVIDNEYSDAHESFYWNENAENYKYDITNYDLIEPLFKGVKYVFHLAAEARIQPAIKNPVTSVNINVVGTCNILQAARTHGVERVIYSSTSAAYPRLRICAHITPQRDFSRSEHIINLIPSFCAHILPAPVHRSSNVPFMQ